MITTAKAARAFFDAKPGEAGAKKAFPAVVNGFTGSSIWPPFIAFPRRRRNTGRKALPISGAAGRPILDAFERIDVNFALEVHPTEIALISRVLSALWPQ